MTRHAFAERLAMADLMAQTGPDAPTLCGEWTTRDLAAHIILRERRMDAAPGIVVKPLAGHNESVRRRIAERDWTVLLDQLRHPPWWSPISNPLLDETINLNEMFVHHEDVRRGGPDWAPRKLTTGLSDALWRMVAGRSRLVLRRWRATVLLESEGREPISRGAGGEPELHLAGPPGELALFLTGRQAHAQVMLDGPPEQVERLHRARLGI